MHKKKNITGITHTARKHKIKPYITAYCYLHKTAEHKNNGVERIQIQKFIAPQEIHFFTCM